MKKILKLSLTWKVATHSGFIIAMFTLLALIPACGPANDKAGKGETDSKKPEVALIMKSLANEFFATMAQGAKQHQEKFPDQYDLIVNGIKNETDLGQQVALIEQMVAKKVSAIVIAPADSKALIPALKRAQKSGVVVINIDNQLDSEILQQSGITIPFVGPDNRKGARLVGDALAAQLKKGDEVAIIEGVQTAFNGQQRKLGFEDAMKKGGMKIVSSQSAQWEMEKANRIAAAMISENTNLKALLCANDSMALGAVAAVKAAGKAGDILVVGFDNISAIQSMIKDGRVFATADQHGDLLAVYGIEEALGRLSAGKNGAGDRETPVDLITADSLK